MIIDLFGTEELLDTWDFLKLGRPGRRGPRGAGRRRARRGCRGAAGLERELPRLVVEG